MMLRRLVLPAVAAASFGIGLGAALTVTRQPTAVAQQPGSDLVARSYRFWSAVAVRGMAAESYDSLEDLAQNADLVVVGTILSVDRGREWVAIPAYVDDPFLSDEAFARFATLTIAVQQIIGPVRTPLPDPSSVKLEAYLPRPGTMALLRENVPRERSIFFLRNKGKTDSVDFYRFTNDDQGLLRDFDGLVRISPTGEDHFLTHLDGERFEDILANVVKARGG
jgi:hypothetical protein